MSMRDYEAEEQRYRERARLMDQRIEEGRLKRGYSTSIWDEFVQREGKRLGEGTHQSLESLIDEGGLPLRPFRRLREFGVATSTGAREVLERGWKPPGFGTKCRQQLQDALKAVEQQPSR